MDMTMFVDILNTIVSIGRLVGVLILTVCVILINELYKIRMPNDEINKKINNRVDIRS